MSYFYDVFISYAPQDTETAGRICTLLEAKGYPCYLEDRDGILERPRDGRTRSFRERVFGNHRPESRAASGGIRSSRMYMVLASRNSMKAERVRTELFLAHDQVQRGILFMAVFIDDELSEDELGADFKFVMGDVTKVRWKGRRSAHSLVEAMQAKIQPAGIPGITRELTDEDEDSSNELDEKMSISEFLHFLDEQMAEDVDYVTDEANTHYTQAKALMKEDPAWAIAGFERVILLLDGEWKADNVESRRMLVDCYIQIGRLRGTQEDAKKAVERAEQMVKEVEGPADLTNLGSAITVLAGILRKDPLLDHKKELTELYTHAASVYEEMVRKEASKENLLCLLDGYWKVLKWAKKLDGEEKDTYYRKIVETTDAIYAVVCGVDKVNYAVLESSYRKLEKYYRPKNEKLADKFLVRSRIMHLP